MHVFFRRMIEDPTSVLSFRMLIIFKRTDYNAEWPCPSVTAVCVFHMSESFPQSIWPDRFGLGASCSTTYQHKHYQHSSGLLSTLAYNSVETRQACVQMYWSL